MSVTGKMQDWVSGSVEPLHLVIELVRAAEVADAHGVAGGEWNRYLLRDPDGSGRYEDGELLWDASMQADLSAVADLASVGEAVARLSGVMRAFMAGAGWVKISARIEAARAGGRAVVVTVRSAAHELYTLPWELLPVGELPICETDGCLLRYECPEPGRDDSLVASAPPESGQVLVAWSAAGGAVPAAEHIDAIAAAGRAGDVPFDPARDVVAHASVDAIAAALAAGPPVTILHLLCHGQAFADGSAYGLRLDDDVEPVSPERMRALIAPYRNSLRLVVVAACLGSHPGAADNALGSVAQAIHQAGVPAVIAARYPLTAAGSTVLAKVLYRQVLVELWSLERAFLAVRGALLGRERATDGVHDLDWAAVQLYGRAALGLDFRPWIIRPYRGLEAYGREHRRFFFGRDDERRLLCRRVAVALERRAPRFLLVAGASGTGKSSLVCAGLVGDLEDGRMDAGAPGPVWTSVIVRPGEGSDPAEFLARRLEEHRRAHAPGSMIALVLDQLEELFTAIADQGRREAFLRALWQLARDPAGDVFVIGSIRLEYLGRFGTVRMDDAGVPFDRELLADERCYLVRQLGPEQYEEIIRGPAEAVGIRIEPGVLGRLLSALRAEPGALPLLSYTLDQLWLRRSLATLESTVSAEQRVPVTAWWLTDTSYDELGGVEGALATTADALFARLGPAHQDELRRVLVQLVHGHDDALLATRRRGWRLAMQPDPLAEPEAARIYDQVIDELVTARLLVQGSVEGAEAGPWIELAHDSLIRYWPKLHGWYQDARAWLAHTDELRVMARAWQPHVRTEETAAAREREEPYLLRGQRLGYQLEMWQRHRHHLGAGDCRVVQAFLDACTRAEAERQQAARRRLGVITAVSVVIAVVMTVLGLWARAERRDAEAQRGAALDSALTARDASRMAGARELLARNQPTWVTKLLREVARPDKAPGWIPAALDALSSADLVATLHGHEGAVRKATFSADGKRVLTTSIDGTVRVWRADGIGLPTVIQVPEGAARVAALSPDGRFVLTVSTSTHIWHADGTGLLTTLQEHEEVVIAASFSPDGERVVTASADGIARVWRADGTALLSVFKGHAGAVMSAACSPDSQRVVTAGRDGITQVWRADGQDLPVILEHAIVEKFQAPVITATFSPDGQRVLTVSPSEARMWHIEGDGSAVILNHEHVAGLFSADFSSDSQHVVTTSYINVPVLLWRVDGRGEPEVILSQAGRVSSVAFSPDGERVVTTSFGDRTARVWRFRAGNLPIFHWAHESVTSSSLSADGRRAIVGQWDGTAYVWTMDGTDPPVLVGSHSGPVVSAIFSPDGQLVATVSADAPIPTPIGGDTIVYTYSRYIAQVWHANGDGSVAMLDGHHEGTRGIRYEPSGPHPVHTLAFSPNSRFVVTVSEDGAARVWNLERKDDPAVVLRGHHGPITFATFSHDSSSVVTASEDGTARVWSVNDISQPVVLRGHGGRVTWAQFSPKGEHVVLISDRISRNNGLERVNPAAMVWRVDGTGRPMILSSDGWDVTSAAFSPNGTRVAVSTDNAVQVWHVDGTGFPFVLQGYEGSLDSVAFSPDGRFVIATSEHGTARVWRIDSVEQPIVLKSVMILGRVQAMFTPDSQSVITIYGGTVQIWPLDIPTLQSRLHDANTDCLPRSMRQTYLGEDADRASRKYQACERTYGRIPPPFSLPRPPPRPTPRSRPSQAPPPDVFPQ